MKQYSFLFLLIFWLAESQIALAQTLHVVLAADTSNANAEFAKACRIDFRKMQREVNDMAAGARFQLKLYPVAGRNFTSEKLKAAVAGLQPGRNDVCMFYFSGAGLCNANDTLNRVLRLGANGKDTLSTGGLIRVLEEKSARLNLIVVDACARIRQVRLGGATRGEAENRVYQSLFSACGTLRLFSSRCSELSYADTLNGGVFTNAFIGSLDHFINIGSQSLNWETLFNWARDTTERRMQEHFFVQHPVMWSSPCKP